MDRIAQRLVIRGRVQGVGYRYWTVGEARRLGLDGWVRNRRDGTVEVMAIGPEASLADLREACRRGPPGARVASVDAGSAEDDGSTGFEQRRTTD
jgi:acylphosphatase